MGVDVKSLALGMVIALTLSLAVMYTASLPTYSKIRESTVSVNNLSTFSSELTTADTTEIRDNVGKRPKVILSVPKVLPPNASTLNNVSILYELLSKAEELSYLSRVFIGGTYSEVTIVTPTMTLPRVEASLVFKAKGTVPYSRTNIQVSGVDEADIVKTDGKYIYLVNNNILYIIRAYPPNSASMVTILKFKERIRGIFIHGDKLVVICEKYQHYVRPKPLTVTTKVFKLPVIEVSNGVTKTKTLTLTRTLTIAPPTPYIPIVNTSLYVYRVRDGEVERLWNVTLSGSYITARLINDTVYLISQMMVFKYGNIVPLPIIGGIKVSPKYIVGFIVPDIGYTYTTILAVDLDKLISKAHVFLLGTSSNVYVSAKNIYILSRKYLNPYIIVSEVIIEKLVDKLPSELKTKAKKLLRAIRGTEKLTPTEILKLSNDVLLWLNKLPQTERLSVIKEIVNEVNKKFKLMPREITTIYRFSINGLNVTAEAVGSVPGVVLDQFSMDEHDGYFRIATTVSKVVMDTYGRLLWRRSNNVYILNMNLSVVGKIENLAIGERVYAARYLGNLMYLVTYRRVDPLFGIDLSNPRKPKVIGFLKIPGYSEYLHPYKGKYLIGIGVAGNEEGRGIKISLFDISDPKNIKEVSKVIIRETYWSPLFYDHRAFLINPERGYVAFPVIGKVAGLAVVSLSNNTLSIKGIIPQEGCRRALYIGNYIYAIGDSEVKVVLDYDLSKVKDINLIR